MMKTGLKYFLHNILQNLINSRPNAISQISNNLVYMQENGPIFETFAVLSPFHFDNFFGMLESTESAAHSISFLVRATKIFDFIGRFLYRPLFCFHKLMILSVWFSSCRHDVLFYLSRDIYTNQKTI